MTDIIILIALFIVLAVAVFHLWIAQRRKEREHFRKSVIVAKRLITQSGAKLTKEQVDACEDCQDRCPIFQAYIELGEVDDVK